MIYVDIKKIISEVEERTGFKVTLTDVSELTGVNRNILSQLNNRPAEGVNTEHLSKVIEFFFHILRHSPQRPVESDQELMDWVLHKMISAFPDFGGFRERLPEEITNSFMYEMFTPAVLWGAFEKEPKDKTKVDLQMDLLKIFTAKKKADGEFESVPGIPQRKTKRGRPSSRLAAKSKAKKKSSKKKGSK
ncbi:MAG: helix-turn-helix transcriptional regulator [Bdellovibrionota bacterium]